MQTILRLLICSLVFVFTVNASADQNSLQQLSEQVATIKASQGSLAGYEFLKQYSEEFATESEFDYMLGVLALESGLNTEAILLFERAVLLQPNFAGAWLDLSVAYYRSGQAETAEQLIQHIETNFSPPESLLNEIQIAKKLIFQTKTSQQWKSEVSFLAGYIRNANFGINTSTLQLTPIDGLPITAQLSSDLKPRSDTAFETRGATSRRFKHDSGAFTDVQLAARVRSYANEDEQSFVDLAASGMFFYPLNQPKDVLAILGGSYRHFLLHGKNLGSFLTLSTGIKKYSGRCGGSVRYEQEYRTYYDFGLYDSTIPWVAIGGECYGNQWNAQVDYRYGWDNPDGPRVGGNTKRQELSGILRWDFNEQIYVRGIIYLADYQDQLGFSPLLVNGENRYIHRVGQRLELSWRLPEKIARGLNYILELDNIDTYSNIPLSRYEDTQVFTGLRYQF